MPEFENVDIVDVRKKLWEWANGTRDPGYIVDWADERLPAEEVPVINLPQSDRRPVYIVLDAMSTIFGNGFDRYDALALLQYLSMWEDGDRSISEAEDVLNDWWDRRDRTTWIKRRGRKLDVPDLLVP